MMKKPYKRYKTYNRYQKKIKRSRRRLSTKKKFTVVIIKGFPSCSYFQKAVKFAKRKKKQGVVKKIIIKKYSSSFFFDKIGNSSPLILLDGKKLKNGFTSLQKKLA